MKLLKENIIATRSKTSIVISCWKIFITILFAYIFHHGIFHHSVMFSSSNDNLDLLEDPLPKLSSGQNSWATLGFDQPMHEEILPIVIDREPRTLRQNESAFRKRVKRDHGDESILLSGNDGEGTNLDGEQTDPRDHWIIYLTPMLLKIFSDALCFYMGRLACKLCMQRLCFALPISLVTPSALLILLVMCSLAPKSTVFVENFLFWSCYADYAQESFKWQVICGLGLWWISELWIAGHIWFGKSQRLAFTDR